MARGLFPNLNYDAEAVSLLRCDFSKLSTCGSKQAVSDQKWCSKLKPKLRVEALRLANAKYQFHLLDLRPCIMIRPILKPSTSSAAMQYYSILFYTSHLTLDENIRNKIRTVLVFSWTLADNVKWIISRSIIFGCMLNEQQKARKFKGVLSCRWS